MSDSSFPKSLDYSPDPLAISARAYESVCVPESSGSAREGNIIRIRIPSGRAGTYLNPAKSFLAFTFNNTSTINPVAGPSDTSDVTYDWRAAALGAFYMDGSAYSVIQTMELYNSSNLLESIQNYNVLMNIFMDLQISMGSRLTSGTILGLGHTGISAPMGQHIMGANVAPSWYTRANYCLTNLIRSNEWDSNQNGPTQLNAWTGISFLTSSVPGTFVNAALANVAVTPPPVETELFAAATSQFSLEVPTAAGTGAPDPSKASIPAYAPKTYQQVWACPHNNFYFQGTDPAAAAPDTRANARTSTGATFDSVESGRAQAYSNKLSTAYGGVNGWISRLGPVVPFGQKMRFCLPLVSGVIGTLNCKLFPLNALNSDLLLNITLASNNTVCCNNWIPSHYNLFDAVAADGVATGKEVQGNSTLLPAYVLEEIEYHANIVEISANAQQMIDIATNGQYIIPASSYRNFSATYQAGQTNNEFQVPARFTSLKSLIACQRTTASLDSADRFSLTSRIKNYMTRIQYRVGSLLVPPQPIRMENQSLGAPYAFGGAAPEAFCHLLEAIGQSASDMDLEVGMDANIYGANNDCDYNDSDTAGGFDLVSAANRSADMNRNFGTGSLMSGWRSDSLYYARLAEGSRAGFCWGIDTESFSNSNCNGPLQSGTNCLGLNIMCRIYNDQLLTGTGDAISPSFQIVGATVDHWAHFDMVIVVSGGVASVRF